MPADSLLDMARRACARYSARITDIGDLEYDLIRPVLLKIESPEKLVRALASRIPSLHFPIQTLTPSICIAPT